MCVLLVHHRVRADAPVVLLANRDEAYDRAFAAPAPWPASPDGGAFVAPRDGKAGGTWVGASPRGLVVALTNRGPTPPRDGVRSRGLLVVDVLRRADVADARAFLDRHLKTTAYEPFHLLVLGRDDGLVVAGTREGTTCRTLPAGVHVVTNLHDLDTVPVPAAGAPRDGEPLDALVARLERLAADRDTPLPGDHRICKVGRTRGTVCSAVVTLPADGAPRMRFAAGPPHTTAFADVTSA